MKLIRQNGLWLLCATLLFILTALFHFYRIAWGVELSVVLEIGHHLAVLGFLAILFHVFFPYLRNRKLGAVRILWIILLTGFAAFTLSGGLSLQVSKGVFSLRPTIVGNTAIDASLVSLVGLVQGVFALLMLGLLRELVLFKRTRASLRNWYTMLVLMAASLFVATVTEYSEMIFSLDVRMWMIIIPTIVAIAAMVVNSFRLSWVAYLTMRQKLGALFISLLLLSVLIMAFFEVSRSGFWGDKQPYLHVYSPVLSFLVLLSLMFGILYCTTAFLSLMFHLPTSSDFQKRTDDLAAMHSLTQLVSHVFDTKKLVSTITESAVESPRAQTAWLALSDPRSGSLKPTLVSAFNITTNRLRESLDIDALYSEAYNAHAPLVLNEASTDHRVKVQPGDRIGSLVGVPLKSRDEPIGVLFVTKDVSNGFEADDIETLITFADQASLALDNARLFETRLEKERLSKELGIAREVQMKLLPQRIPELPGLSVAASSVFAQEVGGDYYDFVTLDADCLSVIIADVSGKGTSAAFFMAELKGIYQALTRTTLSPSSLLRKANEAISVSKDKNIFISAICGVLDRKNETFTVSRAGHCPIAMINIHGDSQFLRKGGLGLGLAADETFDKTLIEETIRLRPGDVFALYTDGLLEGRNDLGDAFGYDRLVASLKTNRHESAEGIHKALLRDLDKFTGNRPYFDDLTLVVLKWHGVGINEPTRKTSKAELEPALKTDSN